MSFIADVRDDVAERGRGEGGREEPDKGCGDCSEASERAGESKPRDPRDIDRWRKVGEYGDSRPSL